MLLSAGRKNFDFHSGHIDAGWTFAFATFAGHAELHGFSHLIAGQRIRSQLARNGQPQTVGSTTGEVSLFSGHAEGGAHHPAFEFSASAVVVAHLDRALQSRAATGVGGPIKFGFEVGHIVICAIAKQASVIHLWWVYDFARIETTLRVKALLHFSEIAHHAGAKHLFMKFRAYEPVPMFARMRAFVFRDQIKAFFCDCTHGFHILIQLEIQDRPHMQTTNGCMGIPSAACAVLLKNICETSSVGGQIGQLYRAIFHKGYRFSVALHGHHNIEARAT